MNKKVLNQILIINKEILDLEKRLYKLETMPQQVVTDSVKCSSVEFPYTQHSYKIEGVESQKYKKRIKQYRKMIIQKKEKLIKLTKQFEYELNYIDDSELRIMLRYKYIDNFNYIQTANKMNDLFNEKEYTADGVRMKIKRFLEKIS